MQHFDRYDVLSDNQHGFHKRRSCETQLLTTIQEIASNTAKGKRQMSFYWTLPKLWTKSLMHGYCTSWTTTV